MIVAMFLSQRSVADMKGETKQFGVQVKWIPHLMLDHRTSSPVIELVGRQHRDVARTLLSPPISSYIFWIYMFYFLYVLGISVSRARQEKGV